LEFGGRGRPPAGTRSAVFEFAAATFDRNDFSRQYRLLDGNLHDVGRLGAETVRRIMRKERRG